MATKRDYTKEFEEVEKLDPRPRGTAFEFLINKIMADNHLSLYGRFRTSGNSQEIDGAVIVLNKVFLLEAKWENEDTLAASKLYSFLGKINSKLEGTLGFFISYNELKDNFVEAIRGGLRQNCILIHGPDNIMDIVKGNVDIGAYLEYCYIQASTKNIAHVSTAEFLAKGPMIAVTTSVPGGAPINSWRELFAKMTDGTTAPIFAADLQNWDLKTDDISTKILNVYSTINFDKLTWAKFTYLITQLLAIGKDRFTDVLVEKLKGDQWFEFSDTNFTDLLTGRVMISENNRVEIVKSVSRALIGNNYDWENLASNAINIFYDQTTPNEKVNLAKIFMNIYLDIYRLDKFTQKQLSKKIFNDIAASSGTGKYYDAVKSVIVDDIKLTKVEVAIEADKEDMPATLKKLTVSRIFRKYQKVFSENGFTQPNAEKFIEDEYEK